MVSIDIIEYFMTKSGNADMKIKRDFLKVKRNVVFIEKFSRLNIWFAVIFLLVNLEV